MIELHHQDCLEVMRDIPSASVDMVLCDLPYGTTQNKWDAVIPFSALWPQYNRITKLNAALVFTASQPFTSKLVLSNISNFKYEWIWEKNIASDFLNANRKPMKIHENVLIFCNGSLRYNPQFAPGKPYLAKRYGNDDTGDNYGTISGRTDTVNDGKRYPKTIIKINRETGLHPTQKPVALMEYLIRTYTNEGDTVLDNTIGSGTTGAACVNLKRNFIGIEKDPEYFAIAERRIRSVSEQPVCEFD